MRKLLFALLLAGCATHKTVAVPPVPNPFEYVDMICFIDQASPERYEAACFEEGGRRHDFLLNAPL